MQTRICAYAFSIRAREDGRFVGRVGIHRESEEGTWLALWNRGSRRVLEKCGMEHQRDDPHGFQNRGILATARANRRARRPNTGALALPSTRNPATNVESAIGLRPPRSRRARACFSP